MLVTMQILLRMKGFCVETHDTLANLAENIADFNPSFILMDNRIGEDSGLTYGLEVRKAAGASLKGLYLHSGSLVPDENIDLGQYGFDGLLLKPVEISKLLDIFT